MINSGIAGESRREWRARSSAYFLGIFIRPAISEHDLGRLVVECAQCGWLHSVRLDLRVNDRENSIERGRSIV